MLVGGRQFPTEGNPPSGLAHELRPTRKLSEARIVLEKEIAVSKI